MILNPFFLFLVFFLVGCATKKDAENVERDLAEIDPPPTTTCAADAQKMTAGFSAVVPKQLEDQIANAFKELGFFTEADDKSLIAETSQTLFGSQKSKISKVDRKENKKIFEIFVLALQKKKADPIQAESPSIADLATRIRDTLDWLHEVHSSSSQPLFEESLNPNWVMDIVFLSDNGLTAMNETFEQTLAFRAEGIFSLRKDQIFISAQIAGMDLEAQNLLFDSRGPFASARARNFTKLPSKSDHNKFIETSQKELEAALRMANEFKTGKHASLTHGHDLVIFPLRSKIENLEKTLARALHLVALYPKPKYSDIFPAGKEQIMELGKLGEDLCTSYTEILVDILQNATKIKEAWGPADSANFQATNSFLESVPGKIERFKKLKDYFSPLRFVR